MNANSQFGTLRFSLIMYSVLFTYVAHYSDRTGLKIFSLLNNNNGIRQSRKHSLLGSYDMH